MMPSAMSAGGHAPTIFDDFRRVFIE